jgi:hypothetical protein
LVYVNLPAKIFNAIEYKSQEEGGGGGGGAKEGRSGDGERKERMVSLASITSSVFKIAKI